MQLTGNKNCHWLDSNCKSLVLEEVALPLCLKNYHSTILATNLMWKRSIWFLWTGIQTDDHSIKSLLPDQSSCPILKLRSKLLQMVIAIIEETYASGCGSVGRAVASNTRDQLFESSHRQNCITNIFTISCWNKCRNDENEQKEAWNGPYFKNRKNSKCVIRHLSAVASCRQTYWVATTAK